MHPRTRYVWFFSTCTRFQYDTGSSIHLLPFMRVICLAQMKEGASVKFRDIPPSGHNMLETIFGGGRVGLGIKPLCRALLKGFRLLFFTFRGFINLNESSVLEPKKIQHCQAMAWHAISKLNDPIETICLAHQLIDKTKNRKVKEFSKKDLPCGWGQSLIP